MPKNQGCGALFHFFDAEADRVTVDDETIALWLVGVYPFEAERLAHDVGLVSFTGCQHLAVSLHAQADPVADIQTLVFA